MNSRFIEKMEQAEYKLLKDKSYFGEILLKIFSHEPVPGLRIHLDRDRIAKYA